MKHIGCGSNQFMPGSYVSLAVMLKNDEKKAIKATQGTILIYDTFGDDLVHLNIENAKTILPGKAVKEAGEWPIMFETKAQNAISGAGADISKLTVAFIPKVILFEDGSKFEQPTHYWRCCVGSLAVQIVLPVSTDQAARREETVNKAHLATHTSESLPSGVVSAFSCYTGRHAGQ